MATPPPPANPHRIRDTGHSGNVHLYLLISLAVVSDCVIAGAVLFIRPLVRLSNLLLGLTLLSLVITSCFPKDETSITDSSAPLPSAVSVLVATVILPTRIDLTWNDNSNNENGVKIERKTDVTTYTQIATVGANVISYSDTGLVEWTTYYYRVRAFNYNGNSSYSNEVSVNTPLNAPSRLDATAVSTTQITILWSDNSLSENGYKIERKTGAGGTYSEIAAVGVNVSAYSDTGLISGSTYYYRVRAYNGSSVNPYSNELLVITLFDVVCSTLDSEGDVGVYTSIAIDSNNKVHISYYDDTNDDLKYATNATGAWVYSTIDSAGDVGESTSIVLDSNNKVHISYYDATNTNLKYATNATGSWVCSTLDSPGFVGDYTSIAIDSNNKVHISYLDSGNSALKYATNASDSWAYSTIDSTYCVKQYNSIAIDSNNKVHISYYNTIFNSIYNPVLKYATNATGSWVYSTIDSTSGVGNYNSIAIDSNNKVHISYYDDTNDDLKYATNK